MGVIGESCIGDNGAENGRDRSAGLAGSDSEEEPYCTRASILYQRQLTKSKKRSQNLKNCGAKNADTESIPSFLTAFYLQVFRMCARSRNSEKNAGILRQE